jgi:peptide methionine sulfoxide reductase msrA/msrB
MIKPLIASAGVCCGVLALLMSASAQQSKDTKPAPEKQLQANQQEAIFAGGCFWGTEAMFARVPGVVSTTVGYIGGKTENPTYKQVCTDTTGHAEAVRIVFDPTKVSYPELLDAFWSSHDPTTLNSQGPDFGTQYRSGVFYVNDEQKKAAEESLKEVNESKAFGKPVVTEITKAGKFYNAEEYHQQYFEKKGVADSCHVGVAEIHTKLAATAAEARKTMKPTTQPAAAAAAKNETCALDAPEGCSADYYAQNDDVLKAKLTPEQYAIARNAGTERAFSGKYWNEHRDGIYDCAVCGQPLFDASTKFDSGTGWPSFYTPVNDKAVKENVDNSHGMRRVEVVCSKCESHLGHVFPDGPKPTGLRYCMNSAVLHLDTEAKKTAAAK